MTAEDVLIHIKIHNNNNHNCSLALYPGPPGRAGTITPRTTQVSWHQNSQDQPGELAPKLPGPPRRAGTRIPRTSQASWHQNSQDHPGDRTPRTTQASWHQNSQDHPGELAPALSETLTIYHRHCPQIPYKHSKLNHQASHSISRV